MICLKTIRCSIFLKSQRYFSVLYFFISLIDGDNLSHAHSFFYSIIISTVFLNCFSQLYFSTVFLNGFSKLYFSTQGQSAGSIAHRPEPIPSPQQYQPANGQQPFSNVYLLNQFKDKDKDKAVPASKWAATFQ